MRRWMFLIIVIVVSILILFILQRAGLMKTISPEELKASIEITDVETKWVKKAYQPWPPKLIIVPAISFRVKNITDKPLRYINFNTNFRAKDDSEILGNCFLAAIRGEPVMSGELSKVILLKSNYGVEGTSLNAIKSNPHWKTYFVELFVLSKGSQHVPLGEWDISKKIDFKEPEPFPPPQKKKELPLQRVAQFE